MHVFSHRSRLMPLLLLLALTLCVSYGEAASVRRHKKKVATADPAATEAPAADAAPANAISADAGAGSAPVAGAPLKKDAPAPIGTQAAPSVPSAVSAPAAPTAQAAPVGADVYAPYIGKKFGQGPASVKKIALTFDDGPSGVLTPKVIAILKSQKITATFFMLGESVEKYPDTAKMVADAGFEIGCHSYHHPNMARMSEEQIRVEIDGASGLIEKVTGQTPHLFRPPYGTITANMRKVCTDSKLVIVHWSVDPRDWNARSTPESVYQVLMKHAMGGSIVCIHDIHARTIAALPRIITDLKAKGFEFTTVSGLLAEAEKHKGDAPAGRRMGGGAAEDDGGEAVSAKPSSISLNQSAPK